MIDEDSLSFCTLEDLQLIEVNVEILLKWDKKKSNPLSNKGQEKLTPIMFLIR